MTPARLAEIRSFAWDEWACAIAVRELLDHIAEQDKRIAELQSLLRMVIDEPWELQHKVIAKRINELTAEPK